jgi:hypothetical protein
MLAIMVNHNDVEFALRLLKKQMQKSGLVRGFCREILCVAIPIVIRSELIMCPKMVRHNHSHNLLIF